MLKAHPRNGSFRGTRRRLAPLHKGWEAGISVPSETTSAGRGEMQTDRSQPDSQHLAAVRLGVTLVALLVLAGSALLVLLIDDKDGALFTALAATLLGWLVTLILAKPSTESSTSIVNPDDDRSPS